MFTGHALWGSSTPVLNQELSWFILSDLFVSSHLEIWMDNIGVYSLKIFPCSKEHCEQTYLPWLGVRNVRNLCSMRQFSRISDKAHINDSIGPKYSVNENKNSLIWERGPKWSLKTRHRDGINAGHPGKQIHPVDTYSKIIWSLCTFR